VHRNLRGNNLVGNNEVILAWGKRPSIKKNELRRGNLMSRGSAYYTPSHMPLSWANAATSNKVLSRIKLPSLWCEGAVAEGLGIALHSSPLWFADEVAQKDSSKDWVGQKT
jgi:hypothetical protein